MIFCRIFLLAGTGLALTLASPARAAETAGRHTLYLVRHGMNDNVKGADDKTANALNTQGREQAEFVAARLASLPARFDTIVSSEFTRARETGDIIAARLGRKCQRDALLNETVPVGVGLNVATLPPIAGAEAQLDAAWARYSKPTTGVAQNELLVCHGNVIRWFVSRALGLDPSRYTRMVLANASLTIITIQADGTTQLALLNDVSHVPLAKQTWPNSNNAPFWPEPSSATTN